MRHTTPSPPHRAKGPPLLALLALAWLLALGPVAVAQPVDEGSDASVEAIAPNEGGDLVAQDTGETEPATDESATDETPTDETPTAAATTPAEGDEEVEEIQVDAIIPTSARERALWQVQGYYELHYNLISDDRSGNDWLAWYMLRGDLNITDVDQVSLRMDLEQRFISDPGEAGLFFGDMRFYYGRYFSLPIPNYPISGKASFYLTAPTSRVSQERGYITRPTAVLTLVPRWGPLTLIANGYFRYSAARFAQSRMGDPNNLLTTGYWFQLFYSPLDWFAPSVAWQQLWSLDYRTIEGERQPWQGQYYFELALNFSVPMPERAPALDLSLAYAQGADVLEDGVYRMYFAKRDQSEVYFGLNLTY